MYFIQDKISTKKIYNSSKPIILILDSGIGGISIYTEIQKKFPNINYIYVFDNAGFPYGNKHEIFIIKRIFNIFKQISSKYSISLAIIACNTASIISLIKLRKHYIFPIIGLVPAIECSISRTRNGIVGLLATCNTIRSAYIRQLILQYSNKYKIITISSNRLVNISESKFIGKKIFLEEIHYVIKPWLNLLEIPDTIVLGCTHFISLRDELQQIFPKNTCLIDFNKDILYRINQILNYKFHRAKSSEENIVFCTCINSKAIQISLLLKRLGFTVFKKLVLT
ncbi:glutamate racemase [Candidatus Pantoea edessiphila]|nr:glutamate racemase [Candidatus Pantoea edessiphila]